MKKTMKAYLIYTPAGNAYDVWSFKPYSEVTNFCLDSKDVDFDIPDDFDTRPIQIKALKERQKQAAAAFQTMTTEINRQISQLQAISFDMPEVVNASS